MSILLITCVSSGVAKNEGTCVFNEALANGRSTEVATPVVASGAALVGKRAQLLLRKVVLTAAVHYAVHSQRRLRHRRSLVHFDLICIIRSTHN